MIRQNYSADVVALAMGGEGAHLATRHQGVDGVEDQGCVQAQVVGPLTVEEDVELGLLELEVGVDVDHTVNPAESLGHPPADTVQAFRSGPEME